MEQINPLETFFFEAEDLLTQIEEACLEKSGDRLDEDTVNHLFRAFHTIKGSGGMFGLTAVAEFTHIVETMLDLVRSGKLEPAPDLVDVVLQSKDVIRELLTEVIHGEPSNAALRHEVEAALKARINLSGSAVAVTVAPAKASEAAGEREFHIWFRPEGGMLRRGQEPDFILNDLRSLGELEIVADLDAVPRLSEATADEWYAGFNLRLRTLKTLDDVKDVFLFVEDGSELRIDEVKSVQTEVVEAREEQVTREKPTTSAAGSMVRVAAEKLDRLVNLVGELVISQSRLTAVVGRRNDLELSAPVEEIEHLVSELRDSVLGIRMTPIGATFNRFKRLVHDLSGELGKEIDLETEGAETELDKTVLDQLGDPMVHLIRNSIDHGIETGETREMAGKPRRGTVRLSAAHVGSNVVVTISDDGKGLDANAIRAKAIERGMITADAQLTERELFNLIFAPGFSTAKQITNVSGRGVGMDVVKRQIEALRGTIHLESRLGAGTSVILTLPLTLAIIDGLLVEIGSDQFIVPMSAVMESVELTNAERLRNNGRNVFAIRGELIPYIDLRQMFGLGGDRPAIEKIVIVRLEQERVGLTVDRVIGSHQTVIQNLGKFYRNTSVVSGATITGDGRVALILDILGMARYADRDKITAQTPGRGEPSQMGQAYLQ
jgi:two-component system, chemotaxis family, sensor kinase CheA